MGAKVTGKPAAVLIAGPTASGKSGLAVALAETLGGMVINADSMQVYRELRILTARPTPAMEARAPHRLYGIVGAAAPFSVARWLVLLAQSLGEAKARGLLPIIVGGTGLYFEAATRGIVDIPPIPPSVRDEVRSLVAAKGAAAVHDRLAAEDPSMAARLAPRDGQRVARALEVVRATGRSLGDWQGEARKALLPLESAAALVLSPPRETLYAAIDARFSAMLAAGGVEEAMALGALGLPATAPAMKALGVQPLLAAARGDTTLEAAVIAAQTASRQYAKRQLTWFRNKMISWNWISEQFSESILQEILPLITERS